MSRSNSITDGLCRTFVRRLAGGLLGTLLAVLPAEGQIATADTLDVFFVGNSYTYFNNLPALVSGISEALDGPFVRTASHTHGGYTLRRHLEDGHLPEAFGVQGGGGAGWDVVVLQEQSALATSTDTLTGELGSPDDFQDSVHDFVSVVRGLGATPALYMTWAKQRWPEQIGQISDAYLSAGEAAEAPVAAVGAAWAAALGQRPDLDLFVADGSHPNPAGSYLAACVLYATLTGRSPVGAPREIWGAAWAGGGLAEPGSSAEPGPLTLLVSLSERDAAFLQRMAWETVRGGTSVQGADSEPDSEPDSDPDAAPDAEGRLVEIGRRFTISSRILDEDRPILVGLPAGYDASDGPYPVVYVLDGQSHFHHTTGTVRFLARNDRMPEAIVVAVGNISGEQRTRDMTPGLQGTGGDGPSAGDFPTAGGAEAFLRFLTDELRPWVDERYRTRSYDILIGHSFGGLFITDVLQRAPESFDGYISISPSLWWDDEAYVQRIGDLFERHPDARGSLYMTMGNEGGDMLSGGWTFAGTLEKHAPDDFRWKWNHMPSETHGSVPHRSTYDGLEWIFEGWDPTPVMMPVVTRGADPTGPLDDLETHYAELSERFGWEMRPPAPMVSSLGEYLLGEGRTDDALEVFTRLVDWRPEEPLSHAGLSEALAAACRWDDARAHLGHARQRAEGDERVLGLIDEQQSALEEHAASGEGCGGS